MTVAMFRFLPRAGKLHARCVEGRNPLRSSYQQVGVGFPFRIEATKRTLVAFIFYEVFK